ncbi:MAG: helix-turn-helix domain-containing protein [Sulfurimonadaceae bacterium]|jgi:DNA-binding Xre family transcriptional regulator|nr:helix-turn-helix domain-containing protein [Sulfurimonadaceae bacterium]
MRDFHTIILVLKEYMSYKCTTKIRDKDLAEALGISQSNFATIKKRNSIPFEQVLNFCKREKLSCCEVFFD